MLLPVTTFYYFQIHFTKAIKTFQENRYNFLLFLNTFYLFLIVFYNFLLFSSTFYRKAFQSFQVFVTISYYFQVHFTRLVDDSHIRMITISYYFQVHFTTKNNNFNRLQLQLSIIFKYILAKYR